MVCHKSYLSFSLVVWIIESLTQRVTTHKCCKNYVTHLRFLMFVIVFDDITFFGIIMNPKIMYLSQYFHNKIMILYNLNHVIKEVHSLVYSQFLV